ncbi:hypothetical protein [Roseateles oligotrophus]|uniref:Uncharacterized protein n=1 Tax=Roseateles oligotrophus TaxID=1769250 RepID=A0ABT2YM72_9BURK|nr:hypothetical protein [Roseateles oligotrophus]MCV2371167.1 hypothetical protein [Roseateles oligotrophus]
MRCRDGRDAARLLDTLQAATTEGRRSLLNLGEGRGCANVVVLPLSRDAEQAAVLLLLERPHLYGELAAQWFALQYGFTPTEALSANSIGDLLHRLAVLPPLMMSDLN